MLLSTKISTKSLEKNIIFFMVFLVHIFVYILISVFYKNSFTNVIFVDGKVWYDFILSIIDGDYDFSSVRSSSGLIAYYIFLVFLGGWIGVVFTNFMALYFYYTLSNINLLSYLFFPFYFICFLFPSKDLIVILPLYLFFISLFKNNVILSFFLVGVVFLIRDAFGMVLLLYLLIYILKFNFRFVLSVSFLLAYFLDSYLDYIARETGLFVFERTLGYFSNNNETYYQYIYRVFANLTNLTSRAVFVSKSGAFSLTGLAFFFSGIGILYSFLLSIIVVFLKKKSQVDLKFYISCSLNIFVVFAFSFSPLIQPRYLITTAFFVILFSEGVTIGSKVLYLVGSIVFLIALRCLYFYSSIGLPEISDFDITFLYYFQR
ncbi:hypothetical protein [Marinomonas primoryensis]|jgi:hypothetical protein|uniref:hypothetical protein n=1 Tax=Marinomonas primoryensis TaxID=178399 RepID=UPI003704A923